MTLKERGKAAIANGDIAEAMDCFDSHLAGEPGDWESIAYLASMHFDRGNIGQAYVLGRVAANIHPSPETYSDMGRVHTALGEWPEALAWFEGAHATDPSHIPTINNAGMALINMGRHAEAMEWFNRAPQYDLGIEKNKAFVHLMHQEWSEGWRCYDLGVGSKGREKRHAHLAPWFPGGQGPLVIYGEQGIGDEVLFASCINDAIADQPDVIIETMPRLVGLFRRSFPQARVYGTRYDAVPHWYETEKPKTVVSMASLPGYYRQSDDAFPGKAYLRGCSGRRAMVRGLMDPMPRKKKIGITWTGGTTAFDRQARSVDLHDMMMAFAHIDAEFISLEHTLDDVPEDYGVHVFPYITHRELDYDYTAALVSELDLIVSVPTAAAHLAGALGKKTLVLLSDPPQWRCGGPKMPWYKSMEVMRNWTLEGVRDRINEVLNDGA